MLAELLKNPLRIMALGRPMSAPTPPNRMIDDGASTNMTQRAAELDRIPGMLPHDRGVLLYALAYAQHLRGDIVEIGSWQGKSTCFLAQACRDASSGVVRAIDHFQGNAHAKNQYIRSENDLSDLEANFQRHVEQAGLSGFVKLYNMPAQNAIRQHGEDFNNVRLLFIDGDHSYEGVRRDIENFAPRLQVGGLIVFDDYHSDGPGVVRAVRELIFDSDQYDQAVQFHGVLIARKTGA